MGERPKIICHMMSPIDGRLHPARYTRSAAGSPTDWSAAYEAVHVTLLGDAWLVGRVTMEEMATGDSGASLGPVEGRRPVHVAPQGDRGYAVALDRSARLRFGKPDVNGDAVIVLLGHDVSDGHLAELVSNGISYVVAETADMDLARLMETLRQKFGIERLLLEGGGVVNGSFFAAGLVDELSVIVAPSLVGLTAEQGIVDNGEDGLRGKVKLALLGCEALDHDLLHLRYAVSAA
jgi:riboflavin biosynthesis pyrimidine reductase